MDKIKVVWICGFSNAEIRERIRVRNNRLLPLLFKAVHRKYDEGSDAGIWITNGINEIKGNPDIELHVITTIRDIVGAKQEFCIDGVTYHFIRDENSGVFKKIIRYLFTRNSSQYFKNRKYINNVIADLKPDLVHVIGAENLHYSLSLLDVSEGIPTIIQLQALLESLKDKVTGNEAKNFEYKGKFEKELIRNADYVGTCVESFIQYIRDHIKPDAVIVNTTLPMGQSIDLTNSDKQFTFVHYASSLSITKATDVALRAFAIAHQTHPEITLDLIGNYTDDFKLALDKIIKEFELSGVVTFEGRLPTHDDVIRQIRKAKYALIPIKTDIIPNTLHEAMANGLPLITTVTEDGTVHLNENRESVLLSEIGDFRHIAENMIYLIENPDQAEKLRQNAAITEAEYSKNREIIEHWIEVYKAILKKKNEGIDLPSEYLI